MVPEHPEGMRLAVIWADLIDSGDYKMSPRFIAAIQRDALEYAARLVESSPSLAEAVRRIRIVKAVTK